MKFVTKYLICIKLSPHEEWMQYLAVDQTMDTEEEAIDFISHLPKKIRSQYYILETKKYE